MFVVAHDCRGHAAGMEMMMKLVLMHNVMFMQMIDRRAELLGDGTCILLRFGSISHNILKKIPSTNWEPNVNTHAGKESSSPAS